MQSLYGKRRALAWVIGGDWNTGFDGTRFAGEKTLRSVLNAGFWWTFDGVPFKERVTLPKEGRYPDACFDHIVTKGLGKPEAMALHFPGVSDHQPVEAVIEIPR